MARGEKWLAAEYAKRLSGPQATDGVLTELDARLTRLRAGVADLEPDELAAAVAKIEGKRRQLLAARPDAKAMAQMSAFLPQADEKYMRKIDALAAGDAKATAEARGMIRELVGGKIMVAAEPDGSLWGSYNHNPAALFQPQGQRGSGGRI
jgi:hypothetical protein